MPLKPPRRAITKIISRNCFQRHDDRHFYAQLAKCGLSLHQSSIFRQQALHLLENAIRRARGNFSPSTEQYKTTLLDACGFAICEGNEFPERCKEPVVVSDLGPLLAHPRSLEQPGQNMSPKK